MAEQRYRFGGPIPESVQRLKRRREWRSSSLYATVKRGRSSNAATVTPLSPGSEKDWYRAALKPFVSGASSDEVNCSESARYFEAQATAAHTGNSKCVPETPSARPHPDCLEQGRSAPASAVPSPERDLDFPAAGLKQGRLE